MLLLANTTDKLQLVTSTTANIDVVASFIDAATSGLTSPAAGRQLTTIASAGATTDIVAAPASSTTRNVKEMTVRNRHASTACDVTVVYDANGTDYEIKKVTLAAGDHLEYVEGVGWYHRAANSATVISSSLTTTRLGTQFDISTTAVAEVTNLQQTLGSAGSYFYQYSLIYQSSALTTGIKFSTNFTGSTTRHVNFQRWSDVSATAATAVPDQDNIGAAGHVMACFASRANSNAGRGVSLSVDTANADMYWIIEGQLEAAGSGDLELYMGSEVAASQVSLMVGSSLIVIKTA